MSRIEKDFGFIIALKEELEPLLAQADNRFEKKIVPGFSNIFSYEFTIHELRCVAYLSGVGKVQAAMATTLLLSSYSPRVLVNMGTSGAIDSNLDVADIVCASKVVYGDVDLTPFNQLSPSKYQFGQHSEQPSFYSSSIDYVKVASYVAGKCLDKSQFNVGTVCCIDSFCNDELYKDKLKSHFSDLLAIDMESTAVAHVASNFVSDNGNIQKFIVLRAISDSANPNSASDYEYNQGKACRKLVSFVREFIYACKVFREQKKQREL